MSEELLDTLYHSGIPKLQFVGHFSNKHTSYHKPVDNFLKMPFNMLREFECKERVSNLDRPSQLLMNVLQHDCIVCFSSESTIHFKIERLFEDIVCLLGDKSLTVRSEWLALTIVNHLFWVVYQHDRPILIIVVRSPESTKLNAVSGPAIGNSDGYGHDYGDGESTDDNDEYKGYTFTGLPFIDEDESGDQVDDDDVEAEDTILKDRKVLGEIVDYMKFVLEFNNGGSEVLGVVTTLKEFHIVGLPGCESLAFANSIDSSNSEPRVTTPAAELVGSRSIVASDIIPHDSPVLIPTLLSVVRKAQHAKVASISLLSVSRMYIHLTSSKWDWKRPTSSEITRWSATLTLHLSASPQMENEFLVLKCLHRTAESTVWLAMVFSSIESFSSLEGSLCVIKKVKSQEAANMELQFWQGVNRITTACCRTICGGSALVMPFVILAHETDTEVSFIFDPTQWLFQSDASVLNDAALNRCKDFASAIRNNAITKNLLHPKTVALTALKRMAKQGLIHLDFEWRHVALIPLFDADGRVCDVRAGFIDFEKACMTRTEAKAEVRMMARLEVMCKGISFSMIDVDGTKTSL